MLINSHLNLYWRNCFLFFFFFIIIYIYFFLVHIKPPLGNLEITEPSNDSVTLRWKRIPLPSFDRDYDIIDYVIEAQQVPGYTWKEVARGITSCFYRIPNLLPTFDYFFRIRANTKAGLTDPTMPIGFYRKPGKIQSFLSIYRLLQSYLWHKVRSIGHLMRIELTSNGLLA